MYPTCSFDPSLIDRPMVTAHHIRYNSTNHFHQEIRR